MGAGGPSGSLGYGRREASGREQPLRVTVGGGTDEGNGSFGKADDFQREGPVPVDQLEILPVECVELGAEAAGAQGQEDIIDHLLDLRRSAGLPPGDLSHQAARVLPVLERGRHRPPGPFQGTYVSFHEANRGSVQSARVKLLDHDAGQMGVRDSRDEGALEERRPLVGPHGT